MRISLRARYFISSNLDENRVSVINKQYNKCIWNLLTMTCLITGISFSDYVTSYGVDSTCHHSLCHVSQTPLLLDACKQVWLPETSRVVCGTRCGPTGVADTVTFATKKRCARPGNVRCANGYAITFLHIYSVHGACAWQR